MTILSSPGFLPVQTHGVVADSDTAYARTRIQGVLRRVREPVLFARVKLTRLADPAVPRPAVAQANVDLNGRLVRAQVARRTMHEAVDELQNRLRGRLQRLAGDWEAIRGARPSKEDHEWRHSSPPSERPPYFPRPLEEREVIRHKSFSLARMTVDEAAFDMDMLDYDFHLFIEQGTGIDSVLYRTDDAVGYRLAQVEVHADDVVFGMVPVTMSPQPAVHLTVDEAAHRLNETNFVFVFFRNKATGRGCLLYHRYDGHYGLITPAG